MSQEEPLAVGGKTPEMPVWADPSLKSTSPSVSSTSAPGTSISAGLENEGMTGGKYDLSKMYDPTAPQKPQEQISAELTKEFRKPANVKLAEAKKADVDLKIQEISREWNKIEDAGMKQAQSFQNIMDQIKDPMTPPEVAAQLREQAIQMQEDNKKLLSAYDDVKKRATKLQNAKSTLNKVSEVYDKLTMDTNDDALKATGLFMDKAFNEIVSVIGGAGATLKSAGDVFGFKNPLEQTANVIEENQGKEAADAFRKEKGIEERSFTDILGDGLMSASNDLKANIDEKYADKHYVVSTLGEITGSVAAAVVPGIGASSKIPSIVSGAMLGADQVYSSAKENGLTDSDAGVMTLSLAPILGVINSYGANNIIDGVAGKAFIKEVIKNSTKELSGKTVTKELIDQVLSTNIKEVGKKYGMSMLKSAAEEGVAEGLEAEATAAAENIYDIAKDKEAYGTEFFSAETQKKAALNAAMGAAAGTVFGGLGALAGDVSNKRFSTGIYDQIKTITSDPKKMESFVDALKTEISSGNITQEQANNITNNIDAISKVDKEIPATITDTKKRIDAISLLRERAELEQEIEGKDKFVSAPQNERIKEINQSLEAIANGKDVIEVKNKETGEPEQKPVVKSDPTYSVEEDKAGNKYYKKEQDGEVTFITEEEYTKENQAKTPPKPVEVKNGDTVELPPQIEGGLPRQMVYEDGVWKQKIGNETTGVAKTIQDQAQAKFNETAPVVESNPDFPMSKVVGKVYHGSEMKFDEFKNLNPNITGFWFSSDVENAKTYGDNIYEASVDIRNPLVIDASGMSFTDDVPVTVIAKYPGEEPKEINVKMGIDELVKLVKEGPGENGLWEIKDWSKYDGVIFKNIIDPALSSRRDIAQDTIVVFNNNQIKASRKGTEDAPKSDAGQAKAAEPTGEETKRSSIWNRVLGNIDDEEFKAGVEKEGVEYVVKKQDITEDTAKKVLDGAIETNTVGDLEKVILDDRNAMDRTTRGVLSAMVGKHYFDKSRETSDPAEKLKFQKEAYKYTDRAATLATQGGQQGNAIGKAIKKMYANDEDFLIKSMEDKMNEQNEAKLGPHQADIKSTYEEIKKILSTPEGEQAISEEIEKRAELLFGKETQKKISNFFDGLKIKNDGKLMAVPIPPPVYNGAVEVMKQAALLGAKGAAIIEAGIKHIKANHSGEFDEDQFRADMEAKLKASGVKFGKKKSVTPAQTKSILDTIESKAKRLKPENRKKFLSDVVQEVEQEGGLTEDRFKELYAQALGLPTMDVELAEKMRGYAKIINNGEKAESKYKGLLRKISEAEKAGATEEELKALRDQKPELLKEMNKASLEAKKANEELSIMFKGNKKLADTFIGMMQLGALTPGSILKNVTGMPGEIMIRALAGHLETPVHYILKGLSKVGAISEKWGEKVTDPFARAKGAALAHPKAMRKFYEALINGSLGEDYNVRETTNSITPLRAAKNLFQGKTKGDREAFAANLMESMPQGWMAALMGRALAGPDAFFRAVAETAKAYELGTLKGLKDEDLELFILEPDADSQEKISKAGDEITFQTDNYIVKKLNKLKTPDGNTEKSPLSSIAKVVAKSQALYVKTPTNIFWRVLKLISPEISLAESVKHAKKGDVEAFTKSMSEAAVGYAFRGIAMSLISAGHIEPPVDKEDEKLKLQSDPSIKHAGKMNYSAILRKLSGQNDTHKDTDVWIDYAQWLGSMGVALGSYAELYKDNTKEEVANKSIFSLTNGYQTLPAAARNVMDLSFMQATGELIDALRDQDKVTQWGATTVGTLLTPLLPNTIANISKASAGEKKEVRDPKLLNRVSNDLKNKLFMGDQLPSKVNVWGDKVKTVPEGEGKYSYYLFNVAKPENPDETAIGYKIAELYDKTKDKRVVPELPSNEITIRKVKVPLDAFETEELQTYVGKQREALAKAYINAGTYNSDDNNTRAQTLSNIYNEGKKLGEKMFIQSSERISGIDKEIPKQAGATGGGGKPQKPQKPSKPKK